ncbi:hypothetical protein G6F70_008455 [Rhizopus microsporus]|uniref:CAP-Gly domain-containing protein n=1 Tax=Rhizopus azygosporus TaxID=86630 RepID=A0A367JIV8_RHIAZ|nr:hypothetical protein G6F71_008415 [Rhizopus microsporus]RCH89884.1 hypothetical protein CU097_008951 [Rhizopus azygosporus]KAG1195151.1 hypothetical protein G6F70_008455 [Rhizopus microsporus]KAG1206951.1 hypothetical protein G6F69_008441 [Rhizopus microsporus]KAG1227576.1 hypothetical protein G6F67_008366 [Rhizopus microsporus]
MLKIPSARNLALEDDRIGQRVLLPTLNNMTGTLRYVGLIDGKQGTWAGIELDAIGQGKNDGSVQGKRYFHCPLNSGIFIALNKITILTPPPPPPSAVPSVTPSTSTARKSTAKRSLKKSLSNTKLSSSPSTSASLFRKPSHTSSPSPTKRLIHPAGTLKRVTQTPSSSLKTSQTPSLTPKSSQTPAQPKRQSETPKRQSETPKRQSETPKRQSETPKRQSDASVRNETPTRRQTETPVQEKRQTQIPDTTKDTPASPSPPPPAPSPSQANMVATAVAAAKAEYEEQTKKETQLLYDMLEKVQRERDQLMQEMKNKETAWERLLSSKESLKLQIQDSESQCKRLSQELEAVKQERKQLELDLAERDASLAKNVRDDEKQSQDQRRIERLENLVRDLQAQLQTQQELQVQKEREHAGVVEQMRREMSSMEAMTASLEKECEEMRRTGIEAVHAVELKMDEQKENYEQALREKEAQIQHLNYVIADLKHKQSTLFDDDERDIEEKLRELTNMNQSDQRHRLEEQLELTMKELDNERNSIKSLLHEIEQLKLELNQSRQHALSVEQKFQSLQADFEKELQDKRRLVEESDHAFEAQTKAEDEHEQMKLSKMTIEKQYNELLEIHKQLEQDHNKLMDEMIALESQEAELGGDGYTHLKERIKRLEEENKSQRTQLSQRDDQIRKMTKDINQLEALVENKVFGDSELEEQLELEKKRVIALERELNQLKHKLLTSPNTPPTATTALPISKLYCELCNNDGHDVLSCELSKVYCDNCDQYGVHTTEDCPNQDETF